MLHDNYISIQPLQRKGLHVAWSLETMVANSACFYNHIAIVNIAWQNQFEENIIEVTEERLTLLCESTANVLHAISPPTNVYLQQTNNQSEQTCFCF